MCEVRSPPWRPRSQLLQLLLGGAVAVGLGRRLALAVGLLSADHRTTVDPLFDPLEVFELLPEPVVVFSEGAVVLVEPHRVARGHLSQFLDRRPQIGDLGVLGLLVPMDDVQRDHQTDDQEHTDDQPAQKRADRVAEFVDLLLEVTDLPVLVVVRPVELAEDVREPCPEHGVHRVGVGAHS
jgi:hypothetical protein